MSNSSFATVILADGTAIKTNVKGSILFQGRSIPVCYKDGMWVEVVEKKNTSTVLLANGAKIEAEIVVLSLDGNNGCTFVGGDTPFPIPIRKNAFGVWVEVIEEKEDGTSEAIAELLKTEVNWVEENRAYISSKQHGSSRWHIIGETWDGGVQIDQTIADEKYPSRVNFSPDEVPVLLKVLLAAYLKIKKEARELEDLLERPF